MSPTVEVASTIAALAMADNDLDENFRKNRTAWPSIRLEPVIREYAYGEPEPNVDFGIHSRNGVFAEHFRAQGWLHHLWLAPEPISG